jgi:hypothetical protein
LPFIADQQLAALLLALTFSIVYPAATGSADLLASADLVGVGVAPIAGAAGAALAAADALAVGRALTATPLPQTNLAPFLTHVNFMPDAVLVCPAFLQAAPALTEADDPGATAIDKTNAIERLRKLFFIGQDYWNFRPKARPSENSQRFHSACSPSGA